MYTNDNELLDRRILRYGGFGWLKAGPLALIFEHDEGEVRIARDEIGRDQDCRQLLFYGGTGGESSGAGSLG